MSYWVLALLAVAAGALFGALPPNWPWQRPHPVRGTVSFILPLVGFLVLLVGHFRRWDENGLGRWVMLVGIALPVLIAEWIAPRQRIWDRLAVTGFVIWIAHAWFTHASYLMP